MTILAHTKEYLAEYENGLLTISRDTDGQCKALKGRGIAGSFRECLATHTNDQVIKVFLKMMRGQIWQPLYKPNHVNRIVELYK